MNESVAKAFSPFQLGGLTLKNRFIKAATYEGMTPLGIPSDKLAKFHSGISKGGVALTTVSYSAINAIGRTHENQLLIDSKNADALTRVVDQVHNAGGLISIQLTHCGFFSSNKTLKSKPLSPSNSINLYGLFNGLGLSRAMKTSDLEATLNDFISAAELVKSVGFDAIEIHMGHGYLLSQFLSPLFNKRRDEYGGSIENRMKYPIEVLKGIRSALGDQFPILCKLNMDDGLKGGLTVDESINVCQSLEKHGVDAVILSGGITSKNAFYLLRGRVPRKEMAEIQENKGIKWSMKLFGQFFMKEYPYEENYFMKNALEFRKRTTAKLVYLGGVSSTSSVNEAMDSGFELLGVGRSLIHDPDFINKLQGDNYTSPCNHCNLCLVEMDKEGVQCVL